MHYTTRWDAEAIRSSIVADRKTGMIVREIQRKYNVSKHTVYRWLKRPDCKSRPSTPHHQPKRLTAEVEQRVIAARQQRKVGPNVLGFELAMPASTVYKVLRRHGINKLFPKSHLPSVRYELPTPGAMLHIDVKKLGTLGLFDAPHKRRHGPGYECMHVAIDDCTRVGLAEIHPNETANTATACLERMVRWYASIGGARPTCHDRSWTDLHLQLLARYLSAARHQTRLDPTTPAADQRQVRALDPNH